jgi:hypothetical protein
MLFSRIEALCARTRYEIRATGLRLICRRGCGAPLRKEAVTSQARGACPRRRLCPPGALLSDWGRTGTNGLEDGLRGSETAFRETNPPCGERRARRFETGGLGLETQGAQIVRTAPRCLLWRREAL